MNEIVWGLKGVIDEHIADEKVAEKHFYVPVLRAVWIRAILVTRTCDGRPKRSQMGEDRGK